GGLKPPLGNGAKQRAFFERLTSYVLGVSLERMTGERRSTGERSEGDLGVAPMDRFVAVPRVIPPASDAASKQGRVLGAAITLWETLRLALDSLRAHKLRSFLTLFGVIMAVTTLVVVMSAIAGLNLYVANRVANLGASANFADVRNIDVAQGRFITPADDEHRSEVVFIGADLASKFFPNVDPIGKTIRAETHSYQVIGVAEPFGSAFGQSQDNYMIIPLNTYQKEWHRQNDWLTIFVQSPSAEMMQACEDEARMLMRAWRKVPYDAKDNFAILGSDSIMALWHDLTGNLAFVAMALVSVFLVVGGIVIMNIMLASVTERTREIGLRRSLGARKQHIILQFMTES